jgi:hypothetical protein
MFFEFPDVNVCYNKPVACAECGPSEQLTKKVCELTSCEHVEATFYTKILFPFLIFNAYIFFLAYKVDTFYKKEPLPYWKLYLAILLTLGLFFIISFSVHISESQFPNQASPHTSCSNDFVLLFDIVSIIYVILVAFVAPVMLCSIKVDRPNIDFYAMIDYKARLFFTCFCVVATVFLVAVRYIIF